MKSLFKKSRIIFLFLLFSNSIFAQVEIARPRLIITETTQTVINAEETASTLNLLEKRAFDLINAQRRAQNLESLKWSDDVAKIARLHSENMARFQFFSHVGRDGLMVNDRADALGISHWRLIGENIAFNKGFENPADFAVERWMGSPAHHDNILNPQWRESAVGVALSSDGTFYFTQVFLVRK